MTDKSFGILLAVTAGILWSTIGLSIKSIEQANVFEILFYRSIFISFFIGLLLHFFFRFNFLNLFKELGFLFCWRHSAIFCIHRRNLRFTNDICGKCSLIIRLCSNIYSYFVTNIVKRDNIPPNYNGYFDCLSWCFNNGLE